VKSCVCTADNFNRGKPESEGSPVRRMAILREGKEGGGLVERLDPISKERIVDKLGQVWRAGGNTNLRAGLSKKAKAFCVNSALWMAWPKRRTYLNETIVR